jgi:hypothetical protein
VLGGFGAVSGDDLHRATRLFHHQRGGG